MVELPSLLAELAGGDAVDIYPWWVLLSLSSAQKPECRRFESCPPDQRISLFYVLFLNN